MGGRGMWMNAARLAALMAALAVYTGCAKRGQTTEVPTPTAEVVAMAGAPEVQLAPQPEQPVVAAAPEPAAPVMEVPTPAPTPAPTAVPTRVPTPLPTAVPAPQSKPHYVVKPGDSLWSIAGEPKVLGDEFRWPLLYKSNRDQITDPDLIYPAQDLGYENNYPRLEAEDAVEKAKETPPYAPHAKPRRQLPVKY